MKDDNLNDTQPLRIAQAEMDQACKTYRIVGIDKAIETNVYEKEIWNKAIEAAALCVENYGPYNKNKVIQIRKLKK